MGTGERLDWNRRCPSVDNRTGEERSVGLETGSALARATIDWRGAAHVAALDEVEDVARRFVGVVDDPPHGLTTDEARTLLPIVERAIDASTPHALMTRRTPDATRLIEAGGPIDTAFTSAQSNPFGTRGLLYRLEREARERWLGIHGAGANEGDTAYAEVAFQPPGTALPGPRPYYGDVALVCPGDAAQGATILHRDSFSVFDRDAVAGMERLPDVVLRSNIGKHAIEAARVGDDLDVAGFERSLLEQLDERNQGIEQYVEVHMRPRPTPGAREFTVDDLAEIRIRSGAEDTERLREVAAARGIPVRDVGHDL